MHVNAQNTCAAASQCYGKPALLEEEQMPACMLQKVYANAMERLSVLQVHMLPALLLDSWLCKHVLPVAKLTTMTMSKDTRL